MDIRTLVTKLRSSAGDFFRPSYQPKLYYMRGVGPAAARSAVMIQSRQVQRFRDEQR